MFQPLTFTPPPSVAALGETLAATLDQAMESIAAGAGALAGLGLPDLPSVPDVGAAARDAVTKLLGSQARYLALTPYQEGIGTRRGDHAYLTPSAAIKTLGDRLSEGAGQFAADLLQKQSANLLPGLNVKGVFGPLQQAVDGALDTLRGKLGSALDAAMEDALDGVSKNLNGVLKSARETAEGALQQGLNSALDAAQKTAGAMVGEGLDQVMGAGLDQAMGAARTGLDESLGQLQALLSCGLAEDLEAEIQGVLGSLAAAADGAMASAGSALTGAMGSVQNIFGDVQTQMLDTGLVLVVMAAPDEALMGEALGAFNKVFPITELQQAERRVKALAALELDKFKIPPLPSFPPWGTANPLKSATSKATAAAAGAQTAVAEALAATGQSPAERLASFAQKRVAAVAKQIEDMRDLAASLSGPLTGAFGVYLEGPIAAVAPHLAKFAPPLGDSYKCCTVLCWFGKKAEVAYYKEAFGLKNPLEGII